MGVVPNKNCMIIMDKSSYIDERLMLCIRYNKLKFIYCVLNTMKYLLTMI